LWYTEQEHQRANREAELRQSESARADEARQERDHARRTLYLAHMSLAYNDWQDRHPYSRIGRVLDLLDQYQPRPGEPDLRSFEWYYLHHLCNHELVRCSRRKEGRVLALAYSPVGGILAGGGDDKVVTLWDDQTGRELRALHGHTAAVQGLSFSPDGRRVASASADKTVKVWDVSSGKELCTLVGHNGR
jgi:WD40 repeat protein